MALADILAKIEGDAAAEAARILDAARAEADAVIAEHEALARTEREEAHERAEQQALSRADTIRVNARLADRDRTLALKRELVESAFARIAAAAAALPDAEYGALLAREVIAAARGGEQLRVGTRDQGRARDIADAVDRAWTAAGEPPALSAEPAPFEYGALLVGDRTSVDLSVDAIVSAHRRELEPQVVKALFAAGPSAAAVSAPPAATSIPPQEGS